MIADNRTNEQHLKNAILAGVKKGARSDKEAVQNYRDSESTIRAALPDLRLYLALPPDATCGDGCELGSYLDITLEERDEARVSRDAALAAVERVRVIHARDEHGLCVECSWEYPETSYDALSNDVSWPCPTIAALDGAPEPEWEVQYGRMYFDEAGDPHIRKTSDVTSPDGHRADGSPYWNYRPMRRHKAGPWLPAWGEKS